MSKACSPEVLRRSNLLDDSLGCSAGREWSEGKACKVCKCIIKTDVSLF